MSIMTLVIVSFLIIFGLTAQATPIISTANLDGLQEVPASASPALGAAVLIVEPTTGVFDFNLQPNSAC